MVNFQFGLDIRVSKGTPLQGHADRGYTVWEMVGDPGQCPIYACWSGRCWRMVQVAPKC